MKSAYILSVWLISNFVCYVAAVDIAYFPQIIDHYNETNLETFQQRYYVNYDYFNKTANNRVFLILGGNGGEHDSYIAPEDLISSSLWTDIAQEMGALMFLLEHRYYGESQPHKSTASEELKTYLTIEQALADVNNFVYGINAGWELASDVEWVVFGWGYGGTLATFLRMYYSYLIKHAVVSGGPVRAELEFDDYLTAVTDAIGAHSQDCLSDIQNGFATIEASLTSGSNLNVINSGFNTCTNFTETSAQNATEVANFYYKVTENLAYAVKFSRVPEMCEKILSSEADDVTRIGLANSYVQTLKGLNDCFENGFDATVAALSVDDSNLSTSYRPWWFQKCYQLGFFHTTSTSKIFANRLTLDYYVKLCQSLFGSDFTESLIEENVQQTIYNYGGDSTYFGASKLIFSYGSEDPWTKLGHLTMNETTNRVFIIEGGSHGTELAASSLNDSEDIASIKKNITARVIEWFS